MSKESPSKICCSIKQAIITCLQKANITLGYSNSTPSFALIYPCCKRGPHLASFGDECWICSFDEGKGGELSPNRFNCHVCDLPGKWYIHAENRIRWHSHHTCARGLLPDWCRYNYKRPCTFNYSTITAKLIR